MSEAIPKPPPHRHPEPWHIDKTFPDYWRLLDDDKELIYVGVPRECQRLPRLPDLERENEKLRTQIQGHCALLLGHGEHTENATDCLSGVHQRFTEMDAALREIVTMDSSFPQTAAFMEWRVKVQNIARAALPPDTNSQGGGEA